MAKSVYTQEERKKQFLSTGIKLAKKNGLSSLSVAAVAAAHKVTAPLVFHQFGTRDKFRKAVATEAKKQGVELPAEAKAPKRKRSVKEVKAIKNAPKKPAATKQAVTKKPTTKVTKVKAAKKASTKKVAAPPKAKKPAAAKAPPKAKKPAAAKAPPAPKVAFPTMPAPSTESVGVSISSKP